ncbi:polyprenyl synthetase family protein [Streptomyces sp. NPDC053079]|uniref:polyprenyl synthetase family protein n=1 Tax=Streptomyces sp. NPDC053079 TaxID=3365697 RepID=UPI0037D0494A
MTAELPAGATAEPPAAVPDPATVRAHVARILADFLDGKARTADERRMPGEVPRTLGEFVLAGGKRLRPVLCVAGWQAAGGAGDPSAVLKAAASLELFHAFALIHDDIMDGSDTRRGHPSVHCALAARHAPGRTGAAAAHLGASAAILIGDFALAWSDELLHGAGLTTPQLARVLPLLDTMRTEVLYGQYLDLTSTGKPTDDVDQALITIRYKTAKYTVERPLHIGAALAGAGPEAFAALSDFALPLGEAFQLRDDLLGVFGRPRATGKPRLDDLRGGKHTVLIALALRSARRTERDLLHTLLGNPELDEGGASRIRDLLTTTGARDTVERMIQVRYEKALRALDRAPFPCTTVDVLRATARAATVRTA